MIPDFPNDDDPLLALMGVVLLILFIIAACVLK